jgi:hypothetical protein
VRKVLIVTPQRPSEQPCFRALLRGPQWSMRLRSMRHRRRYPCASTAPGRLCVSAAYQFTSALGAVWQLPLCTFRAADRSPHGVARFPTLGRGKGERPQCGEQNPQATFKAAQAKAAKPGLKISRKSTSTA